MIPTIRYTTIAAAFLLVLVAGRRVQPQAAQERFADTASSLELEEAENNEEGTFAEKEETDGSSIEENQTDEDDGEATSWDSTSSLLETEDDGDEGDDAKNVTHDNRSYSGGSLLEEAKDENELEWGRTVQSWAQHYYNAGRSVTADTVSSAGYSMAMCSSPAPPQVFWIFTQARQAEAFVKKKWNEGFQLVGWKISDAKGHSIKMSKHVGIKGGIWRRRGSIRATEHAIKQAWAKGRRILDITGHNKGYTFVAGKSSEMSGMQSYKYTSSWSVMSRWIKKKWARNFYITAMTQRGRSYFVVMTKNYRFSHQRFRWAKNTAKAVDEINRGYRDSHRITTLFDARDKSSRGYFVVMSKVSGSKLFANKHAQCDMKFKLTK